MEFIKNIVLTTSVTMIFFGVVMILVPEGSMGKSFKKFMSIAMVAVVIASLSGFKKFELDVDYDDVVISNELNETVNNQNVQLTKQTVKQIVENELNSQKIGFKEVLISVDICDDGSINISEVKVVCETGKKDACIKVIEQLGLKAAVGETSDVG